MLLHVNLGNVLYGTTSCKVLKYILHVVHDIQQMQSMQMLPLKVTELAEKSYVVVRAGREEICGDPIYGFCQI